MTDRLDFLAVQNHCACIRTMQAGKGLQQDRLARSRTAGNAENFSGQHVEADFVVHFLLAEPVDDAARRKNGLGLRLCPGIHSPSLSNRMENNASSTMTRKIDLTTARVVSCPTLSADPLTRRPCMQPMTPMMKAKIGALMRPTNRSLLSTACRTRSKYCKGAT